MKPKKVRNILYEAHYPPVVKPFLHKWKRFFIYLWRHGLTETALQYQANSTYYTRADSRNDKPHGWPNWFNQTLTYLRAIRLNGVSAFCRDWKLRKNKHIDVRLTRNEFHRLGGVEVTELRAYWHLRD